MMRIDFTIWSRLCFRTLILFWWFQLRLSNRHFLDAQNPQSETIQLSNCQGMNQKRKLF